MKVNKVKIGKYQANATCYFHEQHPEFELANVRPLVIILPGGGYQFCSEREGESIALAYLNEGYHALVLHYTAHKTSTFEEAYSDVEACFAYVDDIASTEGIDSTKIMLIGFSAGGHLAASYSAMAVRKPSLVGLGYPVILKEMGPLMKIKLPNLLDYMNVDTPPSFIFGNQQDDIVPIENAIRYISRCAEIGIPFASHIYVSGGHGISLAKVHTSNGYGAQIDLEVSTWFNHSMAFIRNFWEVFKTEGTSNRLFTAKEKNTIGVDMILYKLVDIDDIREFLFATYPKMIDIVNNDPLLWNISLHNLFAYHPHIFKEPIEELEARFIQFISNRKS